MSEGIAKDSNKITPERYMQAKTFLDNGVITKEEFLEMTNGYSEMEEDSSSQILANIQKIVNNMDLRLKRLEDMIQIVIDGRNSQPWTMIASKAVNLEHWMASIVWSLSLLDQGLHLTP